MNKKLKNHNSGLTLAELLVALMVASIIFTAVASFTYAMSSANDSSEDISFKQAQIRHAAVRLSELLRNSKLITLTASGEDLAVWRADDNNNNSIDPSELVFIEIGPNKDYIRLLEFPGAPDFSISLAEITADQAKTSLSFGFASYVRRAKLIEQCSNVTFYTDSINAL
ncbi:MAG: prepilin-type N-terminal cleavage/methylation domain-containing protein, partial [Phycisphaerae bacterium]